MTSVQQHYKLNGLAEDSDRCIKPTQSTAHLQLPAAPWPHRIHALEWIPHEDGSHFLSAAQQRRRQEPLSLMLQQCPQGRATAAIYGEL